MLEFRKQFFLLPATCILLAAGPAFTQSESTNKEPTLKPDTRSAQALYQEANGYLEKKFAELSKQRVPYDLKLEAAIKQEQKDLAARNAATLEVRDSPAADDSYYLGMLHHLSGDSDKALASMRRFLGTEPVGEKAQTARAVVVLHAIKKNLIPEAESAVAAYMKGKPQNIDEVYGMETLITEATYKAKDYERMAVHAGAMLNAAKLAMGSKQKVNNFKRDEMLLKSSSLLAEANVRLNRKEAAVATIEELRQVALSLPSGNLFRLANIRLGAIDPAAELRKAFDENENSKANQPPEIIGSQWIDQQPTKLSDLRGHVVLLDFWAPWCEPCRYTFAKLQRWHESYKDKGLVILGLTNYYGEADGRRVTPAEEIAYLRDFKKKNHLPYGFVVADSSANDLNYGVFSIPMSFLIDRQGSVRFIAVGGSETETLALGKMVKKLLDEPADSKADAATRGTQ
jgi:thiol-disulfide isomerase/thioredoxin